MASVAALKAELGDIDIYLLDQVLRGRIAANDVVLDAGCGFGRNSALFLRLGCPVFAVDADPDAVAAVRAMAASIAPGLPDTNFRVEPIEAMSLPDAAATVVISSAVLHFAKDDDHFVGMIKEMWRCLSPGGLFFARLATTIGIEHIGATRIRGRTYRLGDGTTRFLADEAWLMDITAELDGQLADPLKTTIVQDQRCMTTWVLRRPRPTDERLEGR